MGVTGLAAMLLVAGAADGDPAPTRPIDPPTGIVAAAQQTTAPGTVAPGTTDPGTTASGTDAVPGVAPPGTAVSAPTAPPVAPQTPPTEMPASPPPAASPAPVPDAAPAEAEPQAEAITDPRTDLAIDGADITVTARAGPPPGDPFEAINEQSFALTQVADKAVVGPISRVYRSVAPQPVRDGFRNVFRNLHEPSNFLNFLLQHKIGKAAETVARFALNSTVGILGLVDVARRKPFGLPARFNSLSNTLGFYGIGPGPFFFLPLVGPTTLRDALGNVVDGLTLPVAIGKPFTSPAYTIPSAAFRSIDHRVRVDDKLTEINAATNPYAAARNYYLERRQAEIDHLKGRDVRGADGNTFPGGTPPPAAGNPLPPIPPAPAPTPALAPAPTPPAPVPLSLPPYPATASH